MMKKSIQLFATAIFSGLLMFATAPNSSAKNDAKRAETIAQIPKPLAADAALDALKAGNQRFLKEETRKDGVSKADVARLSTYQVPNAVVLSCSDSRVAPELVFDQKLGEVFTIRTAGEALSPEAIGSIEYAIAKLGSHLIVTMGHTSCGAVKAALESLKGEALGSQNLEALVSGIKPRIQPGLDLKNISKDLKSESLANAKGAAKELMAKSKIISDAVNSGAVKIVVGLYDLSSGSVRFE